MALRRIPGDEGRSHRSYLLISAILLVWNAAADIDGMRAAIPSHAAFNSHSDGSRPTVQASLPPLDPVLAQKRGASLQQKFLSGKRVDINSASLAEIAELPGISEAVAAAVIAERERSGGFLAADDLLRVKGIKSKRLKKILPFLVWIENN